jgi:hypothetical protein
MRRFTPAEDPINKLRRSLTCIRTLTFNHGAYLSDPVTAIQTICARSDFIAVGGDGGGGSCKLGVTYTNTSGVQSFLPLLILNGSDHYESLSSLTVPNLTPFEGSSARENL